MISKNGLSRFLTLVALCGVFAAMPTFAAQFQSPQTAREKINFDLNWKYIQGDQSGAQAATFNDASWTAVNLPHNFQQLTIAGINYFRGIGWYRRHFTLSPAYQGKVITLYFEGAVSISNVYINGTALTTNYGGFHPFCYDITQYCKTDGTDNVIALRLDNTSNTLVPPQNPKTGIDYELFGGLNKDVYVIVTDNLYVPQAVHSWNSGWANQGGHYITYSNVTQNSAIVNVKTYVKNNSGTAISGKLTTYIVDAATNEIVQSNDATLSAASNAVTPVTQTISVSGIKTWAPWSPNLYKVYTVVYNGSNPVDMYSSRVGIRSITYNKATGVSINNTPFKILGLNRTNQWPFIGHACPNNQQKRDAALLREWGCNFLRCSHYPMDDAFYDACDSVGLLLWVEIPAWHYGSAPSTDTTWVRRCANELRFMVRNGRNHPSVMIWGAGCNEATKDAVFETPMNSLCLAEDSTRPTTGARQAGSESTGNNFTFYGQNEFNPGDLPSANPDPNTVGFLNSEHTGHMFMSYSNRKTNTEQNLLDHATMHALMTTDGRNRAWCAGSLGWCAFDYYTHWNNSATPYYTPHGVFDLMHIPKPAAYFYKSQSAGDNYDGSKHPFIKITNFYASNSPTDRRVYSNCQQVRLYQGSTLIGTQNPDSIPSYVTSTGRPAAKWNLAHPPFTFKSVAYQANSPLRVEGLINGTVVAADTARAPGSATTLKLIADPQILEANGQDISRIEAYIVDSNGTWIHTATNAVSFTLNGGSGTLVGDNPITASAGACITLAKATVTSGIFSVQASANGLTSQTITITVNPPSTTQIIPPVSTTHSVAARSPSQWRTMLNKNHFVLPAEIQLPASIALYTIGGELVYHDVVKSHDVRISGTKKLSLGLYIVKLLPKN